MKKADGRQHGNRIFSAEKEELFVGFLQAFSFANRPLSRALFLAQVVKHREDADGWDPSVWYKGFVARHKSRLRPSIIKGLKSERVKTTAHDQIKEWVEWFPQYIAYNKISPIAIVKRELPFKAHTSVVPQLKRL